MSGEKKFGNRNFKSLKASKDVNIFEEKKV